jgi:hypothetical protein
MGFGASTEKTAGTRIGAKKGRSTRRLTVTMRTLVQRIHIRALMLYDNESGVGVKETAARSGAQDDGQERADETAATLTGTSGEYATPIGMLGQPSLDGLREPALWNRMTHPFYCKNTSELERRG